MKIELDVLFKKIQKDDKKEVLEFHILDDEIPFKNELVSMAGGMVVLKVDTCKEIPAEFKSVQRDSKKAVLKFQVKGDYSERIIEMYKKAGVYVSLEVAESQLNIDDVVTDHEGLDYQLDTTGVVSVANGQMSLEELQEEAEEKHEEWLNEDVELNGIDTTEEIEPDEAEELKRLENAAKHIGKTMNEENKDVLEDWPEEPEEVEPEKYESMLEETKAFLGTVDGEEEASNEQKEGLEETATEEESDDIFL